MSERSVNPIRHVPSDKYLNMPCSYVGTGCAYEQITGEVFDKPLPEGLKKGGYLPLNDENKYIRSILPIKRKVYYKGVDRPPLWYFLESNKERCCVCVYGHFIYVDGNEYWSFFDNDSDPVVCVWYIGEKDIKNRKNKEKEERSHE